MKSFQALVDAVDWVQEKEPNLGGKYKEQLRF